jgi:hypothetical protein
MHCLRIHTGVASSFKARLSDRIPVSATLLEDVYFKAVPLLGPLGLAFKSNPISCEEDHFMQAL